MLSAPKLGVRGEVIPGDIAGHLSTRCRECPSPAQRRSAAKRNPKGSKKNAVILSLSKDLQYPAASPGRRRIFAWNVPTATRQMPEPDWRSFDKLRMTAGFFLERATGPETALAPAPGDALPGFAKRPCYPLKTAKRRLFCAHCGAGGYANERSAPPCRLSTRCRACPSSAQRRSAARRNPKGSKKTLSS
jgi:hypothetical protein